ncbi:hypothetical protein F1737_05230 [Methanoplanus sp. FWC-SCC4]|uniref:Uncharacterized protein n=1 Tax=Methanochimaera problematica TaxID=2609417 RepID=A0AA97FB38_9EURY|nr:hypothetical protein [Methanoplanus sp. FWC-SCC4]WOF16150.1 hypothetical protein F1737_05230 [Methanoplanus sp. FWC-SCC4]
MSSIVTVEVIGFSDSACGPFPCDGDRTCELEKCAPSENLVKAFNALNDRLNHLYKGKVETKLTLLDDGLPEYVAEIIEKNQPPLPIILVNNHLTPIGRISLPQIREEIDKEI